jgi:hypothetical protein
MEKFVNTPFLTLKVDALGKVVEVVKGPSLSRFDCEAPFLMVLPEEAVSAGQTWERPLTLVLEPPQGTNEKYLGAQKVTVKRADAVALVVSVGTTFKNMPANQLDQVPLLQKMPAGDVVFDVAAGRLHAARLIIERELQNHNGPGSSYRFQSTYTEEYVPRR